ncbi:MAG: ABC transporter ATP-binding protein [Lentisphaeria bacterium]|nr:ABC transporter ATP-binding protein [Lentisphaeria bacterium]
MNLAAEDISFGYGARTVLDHVSFELAPGGLTFLLGANGAGKSTLLKLLCRLLAPRSGKILLDGRDIGEFSANARARRIGVMLQQNPPGLDLSVEEFVLFGRTAKLPRLSPPGAEDRQAVAKALAAAGMTAFASRPANRLSGGEFQRAVLASVLALESGILLLDEPVSAQDPAQAAFIFEMLSTLAAERNILVISHDLDLALHYASRVLLLAEGRIFADGPPDRVMTPGNLVRLYPLNGFTAFPARTFRFAKT